MGGDERVCFQLAGLILVFNTIDGHSVIGLTTVRHWPACHQCKIHYFSAGEHKF